MNKITFAHCGDYYYPIYYLLKNLTNSKIIVPPATTKKTIELGNKYSPELICLPFKYNLGNFIEALDKGANIIIHAGGGCKYGYYPEVQEQILRDLGYEFKFYNLISEHTFSIKKIYKIFKELNPKINIFIFTKKLIYSFLMMRFMDKLDNYIRLNKTKILKKDKINEIMQNFKSNALKYKSTFKLTILYHKTIFNLKKLEKDKKQFLKVGIIGELYTNMNKEANNHLEEKLINMNIIVKRFTNASYLLFFKIFLEPFLLFKIKKYAKYNLGADAHDNIARMFYLKKHKYDGIIHIKPFGCTPEIGVMPILEKVSEDLDLPIIFLTQDIQTSEEGINTRLEAFNDMLLMRKEKWND